MKKCKFCAVEILDEAIKCRFCGEMIKKRGCLWMTVAMIGLIAQLGLAVVSWGVAHYSHGDLRGPDHLDKEHILSLTGVVASVLWARMTGGQGKM